MRIGFIGLGQMGDPMGATPVKMVLSRKDSAIRTSRRSRIRL